METSLLGRLALYRGHGDWLRGPSLEITDAPRWFAPLPERGPFLAFLNFAPEEGLIATLELVEHATSCWQRAQDDTADSGYEVLLDGEAVALAGDANVTHWHRGDSRVPSVLASALMAVEAWLYRRLDAGEEIFDTLERLMSSRSLAVWGLLAEIAAYRPQLVRGPLAPLITGANLLRADKLYRNQPHDYLLMPAITDRGWETRIRSWHTMEHRSRRVLETMLADVLSGVALADELRAARERWQTVDALVEALQPEWGERVKELLRSSWSARSAVYLFGEPGAERIHEQALEWLAEREHEGLPSDAELDQALAEMLVSFTRATMPCSAAQARPRRMLGSSSAALPRAERAGARGNSPT